MMEFRFLSSNPLSTKISSTLFVTLICASEMTSTIFGGRSLQLVRAPQSKRMFCFDGPCFIKKQKVGRRSLSWPLMIGWMNPDDSMDMFVVVLISWTSTATREVGMSIVGLCWNFTEYRPFFYRVLGYLNSV